MTETEAFNAGLNDGIEGRKDNSQTYPATQSYYDLASWYRRGYGLGKFQRNCSYGKNPVTLGRPLV